VSRAAPRRRAEPRGRSTTEDAPRRTVRRRTAHGLGFTLWFLVLLGSAAALLVALLGNVGDWVADAGSIATSTAYAWGLAARTGGRPVVFSLLTLVLGLAARSSHAAAGWTLIVLGGVVAAAGPVLIYIRSRMQDS